MKPTKDSPYLRFLNALDSIERISPFADMTLGETQVLNYVFIKKQKNELLLVGGLVKQAHLGSQATLHSRMSHLIKLGYLKLDIDKTDSRKKYICLTERSFNYEKWMSKCLQKAIG